MLETPGQIIEECKPCRDSGDMAFPAVQSLDILEGRLEERLNGPERGADPILGDVKDSGFCPVQHRLRRLRLFVAGGEDRPEDGSLRLDVLRWDPLKSGLWRTLSHAGGPSRRPPNQTHSRPEPGLRPRCPGGVVQARHASPRP